MSANPYRDKQTIRDLTEALRGEAAGLPPMSIMHVCGTHEHEIRRHALRQLLPEHVRLVAGPGCPVCITPASAIATAIELARLPERPIVCAYGDIVRTPIRTGSLFDARGEGADVRVVYDLREPVRLARENPSRRVIFFSIGFETTAAPVAVLLRGELPANFFIYTCHRWVPAAVEALAQNDDGVIAGYLLPGHAAVITGQVAYQFLPEKYSRAAAVAGFEPAEILAAMLSIVRQVKSGRLTVANCYARAVRREGNQRAQEVLFEVFKIGTAAWRGIGELPGTGLHLREAYERYDALGATGVAEATDVEDVMPGCQCHLIMVGRRMPEDCALFGGECAPDHPKGPCMVGGEGTCRAHYLYPEEPDD
ncbi:MAG: hydrogenase formation protein HypD [Candidatus Lernaella stagnicola]|nr:hydrogenase formation protein HypD [Candidatus Lernaella stagnicola]